MNAAVQVRLPPVLRSVVGGRTSLDGTGDTIQDVLRSLASTQPALGLHLFNETGHARRNIICLHGGVVVRAHEFAGHKVVAGDELILTNALAGG